MNIEDFREYCLSMDSVAEKNPFGKFAIRYDSILVFYVCGHMFCMVDMDDFMSVTLKLMPDEIEKIKINHSSAGKPLNLSERHWVRLDLNGDIPDRQIYALTKRAYDIVKAKYTRRSKRQEQKTADVAET